jgi:hypothetical protein
VRDALIRSDENCQRQESRTPRDAPTPPTLAGSQPSRERSSPLSFPLWFVGAWTLRRRQYFGDFVPTFIGDNDAPGGPSTTPQRGLYPLGLMPSSTIAGQNMTALVLNPLTSFEMKKITRHTGTSLLPKVSSPWGNPVLPLRRLNMFAIFNSLAKGWDWSM